MFRPLISLYLIFSLSAFPLQAGPLEYVKGAYKRFTVSLLNNSAPNHHVVSDGSPAVGAMAIQFSVSQMGSTQVNIPIAVPPGTADMSPQLSLGYDSQGPNSFAGMGFGLQGLTSITRCNTDLAHNDRIHGIDYTNDDIYCLNGQQLVALNGTYGSDGAEYRIYQDSFTKAISHGQQGNGPAWFTVYSKNGQIATYGNTQDSPTSQQLAQGKSSVAAWSLSKIIDRAGNYLVANYLQDQGTSYPRSVIYTGNDVANVKPYNSVTLDYEDRSDYQEFYRGGSLMAVSKRLSKITSFNGVDGSRTPVFSYALSYETSEATLRSRLTQVTQCAGDGSCLKPVTFKWSDPPSSSREEQMSLHDERLGVVKNDLLVGITGSLGEVTSISYKPLTDSSVYTRGKGAVYPVQDVQSPMFVVAQTSSDDGVGSQHVTSYNYAAARIHVLGFGFLGFQTVTKTDETTGISQTTAYSQDTSHGWQHMPVSSVTSLSNGTVIGKTSNVWTTQQTGSGQKNGTVYAVLLAGTTKQGFELDGTSTSTTTTTYKYDGYGNAAEVAETANDATGNYVTTTSNTYENDEDNWILGKLSPATAQTAVGATVGPNRQSSFTYDSNGFLMSEVVEPEDGNYTVTTVYTRDSFGNVNTTTISGKDIDTRSAKVKFEDVHGQFPVEWSNALGQKTSATYDARFGKPATQTDLNGHVTTHVYDGFGREISVTRPDASVTTTSFAWCDSNCPAGAVYSATTQTTKTAPTTVFVDMLGRTIASKTFGFKGEAIWQTTVYDNLGRMIKSSAPYFEGNVQPQWTVSEHDALGRVTKVTYPNGGVSTYSYQGLTVSMTDALGHTSSKTANVRGWMTKTVDAAGSVTTYQYDTVGNLTVVTDSKGNQIANGYDPLGRQKISMKDPDMGMWTYKYNVLNELVNQTDANGDATTFTYDVLGRVTSRTDNAGQSIWEYDSAPNGIGMLAKINGISGLSPMAQPRFGITDAESAFKGLARRLVTQIWQRQSAERLGLAIYNESLFYDDLSRLQAREVQVEGENFSTTMKYGDCSRLIKVTYPSNVVEQRQYNDLGYLTEIDDASGKPLWAALEMDAWGHITQETLGNGVSTTRTFEDTTGLLSTIHSQIGSSASNMSGSQNVLGLGYQYDLVGNLLKRSDGPQGLNETFDYQNDPLNRLRSYTSNGVTVNYAYDEIGNFKSKSDVGAYTYGENGAGSHAVTSIQGLKTAQYTYDKNGNQLKQFKPGQINPVRSVTYTSFGKPLHIETPDAMVDFKYNADRNRFKRIDTSDGTTKTTIYLGAYERISGPSRVEHRHTIGGVAVYTQIKDTQGSLKQETTSYLHMGSLGSVEAVTDESGQVVQRFHYDPFGVQTVVEGDLLSDAITYAGFTGQEEIREMGLIHMNGRMYDPVIGRFVTADPFIQAMGNSQSLNRYSYVMNNPMTNTDPSGYFSFKHFFHHLRHMFSHAIHDIGHAVGAALRNKYVDLVANIVIGVATNGTYWWVSGLAEAAFSAAVTDANGGKLKDIFKSAVETFATAAVWHYEGDWLAGHVTTKTLGDDTNVFLARTLAHGVTGGALNQLQGGSFKDGFISAASAEALSMKMSDIKPDGVQHVTERTVAAALVGGTSAALTGGNFVNGAKTAAFAELFNDLSTHVSHYVAVGLFAGKNGNIFGHIAMSIDGSGYVGLDPQSMSKGIFGTSNGELLPASNPLAVVNIPLNNSQYAALENYEKGGAPDYSLFHGKDCGSWVVTGLAKAGIYVRSSQEPLRVFNELGRRYYGKEYVPPEGFARLPHDSDKWWN